MRIGDEQEAPVVLAANTSAQAERSASLDLLVDYASIGDAAHDLIANQAPAAPDGGQVVAVGACVDEQAFYQRMGRMLANLGDADLDVVALMYVTELMTALTRRAKRKRYANTLQHTAGYFERSIDSDDKQELIQLIDAYRRGQIQLIVPITLFRHYFSEPAQFKLISDTRFRPASSSI